jgi:hypothetical protein
MISKVLCSLGFHSMYYTAPLQGICSPRKCRRCSYYVKGVEWDRVPPMPKCKPPKRS